MVVFDLPTSTEWPRVPAETEIPDEHHAEERYQGQGKKF